MHGGWQTATQSCSAPPGKTKWINASVFKPSLRRDLVQDNHTLTSLLDRFGNWDSTRDSKVNALVDLLRNDHPGEKVLVFTEYADTADYVAEALEAAGISNVGLASGDTDDPVRDCATLLATTPTQLPGEAARPTSRRRTQSTCWSRPMSSREGQNLQDSHIVVNYDLPWAIIRIIQRAGASTASARNPTPSTSTSITHEKVEQPSTSGSASRHRLGATRRLRLRRAVLRQRTRNQAP